MKNSEHKVRGPISLCLALTLLSPCWAPLTASAQQTGSGADQAPAGSPAQPATGNAPQQTPNVEPPGVVPAAPPAEQQQPPAARQPGTPPQPVGTAVAPYEKGIGVAASRPAGAVIAPGKQRRTRSFLIRVGLLVGAGVAIGTVVGLSEASSSRPK